MTTLFNVRCYSNKAPFELMCRFLAPTGSAQQHIARLVFLGLTRSLSTDSLADGIGSHSRCCEIKTIDLAVGRSDFVVH